MKPGCLKEEAAFHEQHPEIGMSYCAWDMINEKREVIKPYQEDKTPEILSQRLALQLMFYYGSIPGNISTVMMKRRALNDVGTFKESMRQAGDFDMWVRIAYKFPMGFINRPLIYLRRHKEQYSRAEGEGAFHVCEVNTIVRGLVENLPCEIKMISRVYNRWNRHIKHFHHMVKEISLGRFKDAAIICREIMKEDNILLVAMLWFFTGNGRFFKEKLKVKFYV
jgi:hypothetical protein